MIAFLAVYIAATAFICTSLYLAYQDRAAGVPPQSLKRGGMIAGTFLALLWASYLLAIWPLFAMTAEIPSLSETSFSVAAFAVGVVAFALAIQLVTWYDSRGGWALLFYAGILLARDHASAIQFAVQENQSFQNPTRFDRVLSTLFILMAVFALSAAVYAVVVSFQVESLSSSFALNGQ